MQDKDVTRAGFGPRAAAYLIDRLLLLIAMGSIRAPFAFAALLGAGQLTARNFIFRYSVMDVICWLAASAYFVLLTYFGGGTLGKKIMKLSVQKEDGSSLRFIDALYRETVGRFLSGILCIGYLMSLVDKNHWAFHDWLCDTRVIYDEVTFRPRDKKAPAASAASPWTPVEPAPELPEPEAAPELPAESGEEE